MHDDVAKKSGENQALNSFKSNTVGQRTIEAAEAIRERTGKDVDLDPKAGSAGMIVAVSNHVEEQSLDDAL